MYDSASASRWTRDETGVEILPGIHVVLLREMGSAFAVAPASWSSVRRRLREDGSVDGAAERRLVSHHCAGHMLWASWCVSPVRQMSLCELTELADLLREPDAAATSAMPDIAAHVRQQDLAIGRGFALAYRTSPPLLPATAGADPRTVLTVLAYGLTHHAPRARLVGNVLVEDALRALNEVLEREAVA